MPKKMLIDAANKEEVRVCVLENGRVEDFDFESASRKPLRGNIYLARVTRVEPSLQAAFVEYGGNRHGFLAFNEIHPDYYQIPVSDRRAIQEAEAEEAALADQLGLGQTGDEDEPRDFEIEEVRGMAGADREDDRNEPQPDAEAGGDNDNSRDAAALNSDGGAVLTAEVAGARDADVDFEAASDDVSADESADDIEEFVAEEIDAGDEDIVEADSNDDDSDGEDSGVEDQEDDDEETNAGPKLSPSARAELLERYKEVRRRRVRLLRNYKIQEVVKRRQIILVQVVKEERGNKGAALTSYLSLAGRYCVLMPNTPRGGGISRKIPNASDRKRLRKVVGSLDVAKGMGLIIRTAGAKRTKAEIKRDYDYLVRLWENIRTLTLKSIAPALIYEEASLIKRAIRDLYDKDIDKILVEGDDGYREAKDFMKMLMPSHAKNVQPYKEATPLFLQYDIEQQLDAMYQPVVRLKSGGYIVINQTEALIAIDVNSGKSTRERNIEQTALKTNTEAAKEVARQCRMRDLAGLLVIDFIDMEEQRNNRIVEKRLKDALKFDRARIQVGRISSFGLLEMSRQRRRSGIVDGTTHSCPTCSGAGVVRSHEMASLRILRSIEAEAINGKAGELKVRASLDVTLYVLNHKREWLRRIEESYGVSVELVADPAKAGDHYEIESSGQPRERIERPAVIRADTADEVETETSEEDGDEQEESASADLTGDEDADGKPRKRRRRRRRRRGEEAGDRESSQAEGDGESAADEAESEDDDVAATAKDESGGEDEREGGRSRRRRRGRRGGRRSGRRDDADATQNAGDDNQIVVDADADQPDAPDAWATDDAPLIVNGDQAPAPSSEPAAEEVASRDIDQDEDSAGAPRAQPSREDTPADPASSPRKGWWQRMGM